MKNLLKLIGVGIVSGAACRLGSMMTDVLFPKGLHKFYSDYKERKVAIAQTKKEKG